MKVELHILVGLPGAGKSYFAISKTTNPKVKDSFNSTMIDFDAIMHRLKHYHPCYTTEERITYLKEEVKNFRYKSKVYIDGLFLTKEDQEFVVSLFLENPKLNKFYTITKVVFDYWEPNVKACLWNDRGRRDVSSKDTIRSMKCAIPDIKYFKEKYPEITFQRTHHNTVPKPAWEVFFNELGVYSSLTHPEELWSDSWCTGGECWSWGNETRYSVDPEEPLDFNELDSLLEKICPNITFLLYKKLKKECVTLGEKADNDYYSRTSSNFWICNLPLLYNFLVNNGLIMEVPNEF